MTREEAEMVLDALGALPGLAVQCTNPHVAQQMLTKVAKERGVQIACVKSLSPMEVYLLAKQHEAVASVYRGRGLPETEVARLQLQGHVEDRASPAQSVSSEGPGQGSANGFAGDDQ